MRRVALRRKTIVFVGAFADAADGTMGGVQFACRTLLESPLSQFVEWRLVDSMMKSLPLPSWPVRIGRAIKRVLLTLRHVASRRVDGLLVFSPASKFSMTEKGLMCVFGRCFGKRVVLSLCSEVNPPRRWRPLSNLLLRTVYRCCDAIICQGPVVADKLTSLFAVDRSKLVVIPNWIDTSALRTLRRDDWRKRTGAAGPNLLYVGWLDRPKGVYELLAAHRQVLAAGRPCRLILCGGGPDMQRLKDRASEMGTQASVEFRGWIKGDAKLAAFREGDLFVLPSYTEGLPNALLEAMAAGLPVVTTPVGSIPHVVSDGHNGYLVPPRDADGLAQAIQSLIDQPEEGFRMGKTNRAEVLEKYDVSRLWPRVAETLDVLVPGRDEEQVSSTDE
jgi:glycosyltransferase involved in cell wall biosynthesis